MHIDRPRPHATFVGQQPCLAPPRRSARQCAARLTVAAGQAYLDTQLTSLTESFLNEKRGAVQAGTYLIRDEHGSVQYVGYARDVRAAIKGHRSAVGAARCHSVETRPLPATVVANRQHLQAQQDLWLQDLGLTPPGNAELASLWQGGATGRPSSAGAHEFSRTGDVTSIDSDSDDGVEITAQTVDEALDEVRPYLQADGGDVEVASVSNGEIYLRFQGACGTCSSSSATMSDQIERALKRAFGTRMKGVHQVEQGDSEVTTAMIDSHLDQLRPAIKSFGGFVEVIDVQSDRCSLSYTGPAQIRAGVEAAIKDKFPTIKEIGFEAS